MTTQTHLVHVEYELLEDGDETEHTRDVNMAVNWDAALRFEFPSQEDATEFMRTLNEVVHANALDLATRVVGRTNEDART